MKKINAILMFLACSIASAEDGNEFKPVHMLPDASYSTFMRVMDSKTYIKDRLTRGKAVLCNGNSPKIAIKYSITHVPPQTTGLALNVAASTKKQALDQLRDYLKTRFFADSANDKAEHAFMNGFYVPYTDDLSMIRTSYTFILPKPLVSRLMGKQYTKESFGDSPAIQHYGYNPETEKFDPQLAIQGGEFMFDKVMAYSTSIIEAPKPDGSVKFLLKLDLSSFCQYATPVTDLISE